MSGANTKKTKVLLAMSGGVDSAVAAALLQRDGNEVVGCFMRLGSPGESLDELQPAEEASDDCDPAKIRIGHQGCCSIHDAADARLVAARLDIPLYICNFKKDFGRIIDYFAAEYDAGRTPNPCVRCNDWLKFGRLREYAQRIGADFIASGHHARIDRADPDRPLLKRGIDTGKDQSYVLFGLPRERLREMLLPVGEHRKDEIRAIAQDLGLTVYDKPDSQEICFVPDNDYAGMLRRRAPASMQPGAIVDTSGRVIGEHEGHQHFTVGQRRGLRLAVGRPLYVIAKDSQKNTITVGDRSALLAGGCEADDANWLMKPPTPGVSPPGMVTADPSGGSGGSGGEGWVECRAQVRSNGDAVAARVRSTPGPDGSPSGLEVQFDEPLFAVAPGQAVVCYLDDAVLCGGWIRSVSGAQLASSTIRAGV